LKYLKIAQQEALKSLKIDEVPVGAVLVKNDVIIAKAHNLREKNNDVTGHAEIICLKKAAKKLKS